MKPFDCNRHRIDTLYENSRFGWLGLLLLFFVTLYVVEVKDSLLLPLYALLMAVGIGLYIANLRAQQRALQRPDYQPGKWARSMALVSALNGALLSAAIFAHLDLNHHAHVYLVATILVMSLFGSSLVAAPCKWVHTAWALSSMLPLSLWLAIAGDAELRTLGLMLLAAGIPTSFLLNHYYYQMNEKSFRLRMENLDLIEQVNAAKDRAERAHREKSNFLTATSHDLRQPLHALDLFLDALATTPTTAEQKNLLAKAQQSSHALAELLHALLEISQLESGQLTPQSEPLDLRQLLEDVAAEFSPALDQQGMVLRSRLSPALVASDRLLLARMVRNLMANAIKHSRASKLLLTLRPAAKQIHIDLYDNGIGISDADQKEVFSAFHQLSHPRQNDPTEGKEKGLGLGLAIVKRLATVLGCQVQLSSTAGRGCHFRISLPRNTADTPTPHAPDEPSNIDVSGLFVLLIEDDNTVREAMRTLLKQWQCELLVGESLAAIEQELDALPYPPPSVLLLDYRLGHGTTGLDAAARLQHRFNAPLPVIMITAERDPALLQQLEEASCTVLGKPVAANKLKQALAHCSTIRHS